MKRVLILGAAGMAGHVLYTVLKNHQHIEVFGTVHKVDFDDVKVRVDIYDRARLKSVVQEVQPDVVINCIGVLIKGAKSNVANAIYSNAYYPHFLSEICSSLDCKLIHISTDCVFSGKDGSYNEDSIKDAKDTYGLSKSLGEVVNEKDLTIRTSIIGPEIATAGEGLFDWFVKQKGTVTGFRSAFWSGVTTLELANFIVWSLSQDLVGLVHLTNNEPISKFELLSIIADLYNLDITLSSEKDYKVDKSFRNTRNEMSYDVPSYPEMIKQQRKFMYRHADFYDHYKKILND